MEPHTSSQLPFSGEIFGRQIFYSLSLIWSQSSPQLRVSRILPQIYQMANFYFRCKRHQDLNLALDYLMAKQSKPPRLCTAGLFAERKPVSLFHGVWHIPADEIDRAGSFATHLYRATKLALQIAIRLSDHESLMQIGTSTRHSPRWMRGRISVLLYNCFIGAQMTSQQSPCQSTQTILQFLFALIFDKILCIVQ